MESASDTTAIRNQVIALVAGISAYPTAHLHGDQAFAADLGLDSMMMMDLVVAIRARWPHVAVAPEDFLGLRTIEDAVQWLGAAMAGQPQQPEVEVAVAGTPPAAVPVQAPPGLPLVPDTAHQPRGAVPETTDLAAAT